MHLVQYTVTQYLMHSTLNIFTNCLNYDVNWWKKSREREQKLFTELIICDWIECPSNEEVNFLAILQNYVYSRPLQAILYTVRIHNMMKN